MLHDVRDRTKYIVAIIWTDWLHDLFGFAAVKKILRHLSKNDSGIELDESLVSKN